MPSQLSDEAIRGVVGRLPSHGATINVSFTGTAAVSSALTEGQEYDVVADQHCYICESNTAVADADTTDYLLPAYTIITITPQTDLFVSVIQVDTAGTLRISPRVASGV